MLNTANVLTLSRIAAIPLVVACFWLDKGWSQWISMALFVLAGITDYFDGYFARRYHQISRLGASSIRSPTSCWSPRRC
jgi:cardiolipin synthase